MLEQSRDARIAKADQTIDDLKSQISQLTKINEDNQVSLNGLKGVISQQDIVYKNISKELAKAKQQSGDLSDERAELNKAKESVQQEIVNLTAGFDTKTKELTAKADDLAADKAQLEDQVSLFEAKVGDLENDVLAKAIQAQDVSEQLEKERALNKSSTESIQRLSLIHI